MLSTGLSLEKRSHNMKVIKGTAEQSRKGKNILAWRKQEYEAVCRRHTSKPESLTERQQLVYFCGKIIILINVQFK